jgi:hypothetical protein
VLVVLGVGEGMMLEVGCWRGVGCWRDCGEEEEGMVDER